MIEATTFFSDSPFVWAFDIIDAEHVKVFYYRFHPKRDGEPPAERCELHPENGKWVRLTYNGHTYTITDPDNIPKIENERHAIDRFIDFKERVAEMGIMPDEVTYEVTEDTKEKYRVRITTNTKHPLKRWKLVAHAIIGLVAHFDNRKWIDSYGYTYIMKERVAVCFGINDDEK